MADATITLGYGGGGWIDDDQVLITSGSFSVDWQRATYQPTTTPRSESSRTKVIYSKGTKALAGSLAFDLLDSQANASFLNGLFTRGRGHDLTIHDGYRGRKLTSALNKLYLSSVSVSSSPGSLVSVSVSASARTYLGGLSQDTTITPEYQVMADPLVYFDTGNDGVTDWSLSWNQELTPVYANSYGVSGNEDGSSPMYFRYGPIEFTYEITTVQEQYQHTDLYIGNAYVQLYGFTQSAAYNYGGQNEFGNYTHSFNSAGRFANSRIISITDIS